MTVKEYIEARNKKDTEAVIAYNQELVNKYPWLQIRNYQGYVLNDFTCTELDAMEDGWRIAFGMEMCEEIQQELLKEDTVDDFCILQIKEKFGGLRFYAQGITDNINKIIRKYEELSYKICIECGQPARWRTIEYVLPFCNACKEKYEEDIYDSFREI